MIDMALHEILRLTVIEYVAWMLLLSKIINEKIFGILKPMLIYMPVYLAVEISRVWLPGHIVIILYNISFMLFVKIAFKKNILQSIFLFVYSLLILFFLQTLFAGSLSLVVLEFRFTFINGLIMMSATLMAAAFSYFFVPLNKVSEALEEKSELLYIVIAIAFMLITAWDIIIMSERLFVFTNILIVAIFLAAFVALCYFAIKTILELKEKNKEIELYNQYETILTEYGDKQHEYGKHLQTISALAYLNDDLKTSKHIKEYLNDMRIDGEFTDAEMLMFDRKPFAAFLHVKMTQLRTAGISCWLDVTDYAIDSKIKDHKLVEAVGILIDNAWEASNDVIVNISKQANGKASVEILNKHRILEPNELDHMFKRGYSTKGKNRGIGLYNLEKIITVHNFKLACQNKTIDGENYVSFTLIL